MKKQNVEIKNKKAYFNYEIIDKYSCGICLFGTEVKSIKNNRVNFVDSYCLFINNELYIRNLNISKYEFALFNNHDPIRDRKLLLTKKELRKLNEKVKIGGLTIVPLRIFINEKGLIKIDIALAKGKHNYDKRNTIRDRDIRKNENINLKNKFINLKF